MRLKVKLLTIAILALLLCAAVPMAATATGPKENTTITTKAYNCIWDTNLWMGTQGKVIGRYTFDTTAYTWSFTPTGNVKYEPSTTYFLKISDSSDKTNVQGNIIGIITTGENGELIAVKDRYLGTGWGTGPEALEGMLNSGDWIWVSSYWTDYT